MRGRRPAKPPAAVGRRTGDRPQYQLAGSGGQVPLVLDSLRELGVMEESDADWS